MKLKARNTIVLAVIVAFTLTAIVSSFSYGSVAKYYSIQSKPIAQIHDLTTVHPASNVDATNVSGSTLLSSTWTQIGAQGITSNSSFVWGAPPFSGRVTAIIINSSNTNEIFLGTAQGGLWRTTDGGSTWIPLFDNQASLAVGAIALSPNNNVIYVGTGEGNNCGDCAYGVGVLKSVNGGATWSQLGTRDFNGLAITSILVNPLNANELMLSTNYAYCCRHELAATPATYAGIWISTDAGSTWTEMASGGGVAQLALVPHLTTYYPIAGNFAGDAYVYTNAANQSDWSVNGLWNTFFSETSSGIDPSCSNSTYCRVAIAATASNPNFAYLALINSSSSLAAMGYCDITATVCAMTNINMPSGSTDQSGTFQPPCGSPGQGDYDLFFAVNPSDKTNMYFGCTTAFVTTNSGSNWTAIGGYSAGVLHPDMHAFAFMPGTPSIVFIGNDGGIWKSTNEGSSWVNMNKGLDTLQFYHVAVSNSGTVLAGAQDNGCNLANGNAWVQDMSGDGGWVGFNPSNSTIVYCTADGQPFKSTNGGLSFLPAYNGISETGAIGTAPMGQDPNNPSVFYFGVNTAIYKTIDEMQNWTLIYNGTSVNVISLAVAPSNSSVVYAGLDNGTILSSANGGAAWNILGSLPNSDPAVSIVVNPSSANEVYVAGSAFQSPVIEEFANSTQKAFPSSGLPNLSVNIVKINQGNLYAGLDAGVYVTSIGGSSWSTVASGLPNVAVDDLAVSSNGTIYVATHGRGVWSVLPSSSTTTSVTTLTTSSATTTSSTTFISFTSTLTTSTTSSTTISATSQTSMITTSSTSSSSTMNSQTTNQATVSTSSATMSSSVTSTTTSSISSSVTTTSSSTSTITSQSTSSSSSGAGGGVPKFPFQTLVVAIFTTLIVGSYLALRRHCMQ
ncbi:MAG: hypothetical protein JRN20_00695 [Nitrososphaerota archaeon]|nr:hypothetical protein [Nitrososphaerota archaeon]MDG6921772.1 hypothetical protein [Nitrososphaerota archaeon]